MIATELAEYVAVREEHGGFYRHDNFLLLDDSTRINSTLRQLSLPCMTWIPGTYSPYADEEFQKILLIAPKYTFSRGEDLSSDTKKTLMLLRPSLRKGDGGVFFFLVLRLKTRIPMALHVLFPEEAIFEGGFQQVL